MAAIPACPGAGLTFVRILMVLFAVSVLSACGATATDGRAGGSLALEDCTPPGSPRQMRCGRLEVPEDRGSESGRRVSIEVHILPALRSPAEGDPVFYFEGGPGGSAIDRTADISTLLRRVNETRDLVFVDVRGTGRSNALTCPPVAAGAPLQSSFDDFLPDDFVRRCVEHLRSRADVRFYTQPFAIDDVDEVRAALGYRQINLFGSSGGTRQAQIYMKRHPGSVRSAILHGVQAMDGEMPLPFSRALETGIAGLLDACERNAACHAEHPDLRRDWESVRGRLERGSVTATVQDPRTGRTEQVRITKGVFADGLRHAIYAMNQRRAVAAEISRAARGDFDRLAERLLRGSRRFDTIADGMFITATCAEDIRFIDQEDIRRSTAGTFLGDYRVRRQQSACRLWPRGEGIDEGFQAPVTLDVPVLIISGELDVATPPSEAERVARHLPRARHVIFPGQGHDFANPPCAAQLIERFLADLDPAGLDVRCVSQHHSAGSSPAAGVVSAA